MTRGGSNPKASDGIASTIPTSSPPLGPSRRARAAATAGLRPGSPSPMKSHATIMLVLAGRRPWLAPTARRWPPVVRSEPRARGRHPGPAAADRGPRPPVGRAPGLRRSGPGGRRPPAHPVVYRRKRRSASGDGQQRELPRRRRRRPHRAERPPRNQPPGERTIKTTWAAAARPGPGGAGIFVLAGASALAGARAPPR